MSGLAGAVADAALSATASVVGATASTAGAALAGAARGVVGAAAILGRKVGVGLYRVALEGADAAATRRLETDVPIEEGLRR